MCAYSSLPSSRTLVRQEPSPMNLAEKPSTLQAVTDLNLDPY
jgi:hypothetical protein